MARLLVKTAGFNEQVIELKLGVTRLGRSSKNDFQIEHPTISSQHCELTVEEDGVVVRDCDSTNGTFVAGEIIKEVKLSAGQSFCIGDVELLVESTTVTVAIPRFELPPHAAPPVVLTDGSLMCPRHSDTHATHQCTFCLEIMCDDCVKHLRRRGGKLLKLCPICSNKVDVIGGKKPKKRSLLGFLNKTVKMSFLRHGKDAE